MDKLTDNLKVSGGFRTNMSKSSASANMGFPSVLTLLFIGLKLTRVIDWSWLWVLSPLWIPAALVLSFLLFALIVSR